MLTTGHQLTAARSLVGMKQSELADKAGLSANALSAMEKRGKEPLTSSQSNIVKIMKVLEAEGVEFLNHGQPGVRLRAPS